MTVGSVGKLCLGQLLLDHCGLDAVERLGRVVAGADWAAAFFMNPLYVKRGDGRPPLPEITDFYREEAIGIRGESSASAWLPPSGG